MTIARDIEAQDEQARTRELDTFMEGVTKVRKHLPHGRSHLMPADLSLTDNAGAVGGHMVSQREPSPSPRDTPRPLRTGGGKGTRPRKPRPLRRGCKGTSPRK